MLEENNDIDNLFKSTIEPHEMEPTDKVWTSLNAKLGEKQVIRTGKKGGGFTYLYSGIALLLLSFVAYQVLSPSSFLNNKDDKKVNELSQEKVSANAATSSNVDEKVKTFFGKSGDNNAKAPSSTGDKNNERANKNSIDDSKLLVDNAAKQEEKSASAIASKTFNKDKGTEQNAANSSSSNGSNKIALNKDKQNSPGDAALNTASNSMSGDVTASSYPESSQSGTSAQQTGSENGYASQSSVNAGAEASSTTTTSITANTPGTNALQTSSESNNATSSEQQAANEPEGAKGINVAENKESLPVASSSPIATASQDATGGKDATTNNFLLNKAKRRFSLDAFYAPEVANHSLSSADISQSSATTRNEKFNFSFNTGALLRFDLNDKWSVSLGCTYSTLDYSTSVSTSYIVPPPDSGSGPNQDHHIPHGGHGGPGGPGDPGDSAFSHQFKDPNYFNHYYSSSPSSNDVRYNNSCGSINLNGDPSIGPPPSNHPGDLVYLTTSAGLHLEYINVPLTISFKLSHRRFDYYGSAGISMGLLIKKQATVNIGDSYTETTSDIDGLANTTYNYLFSAGIRYHFYNGLSVFIEPAYRSAISSITQGSSQGFYPYYFGLNTGVSIHF